MAAAFERARAALDRTPPLSSTVERVLQRCGPRADLMLETEINLRDPVTLLDLFTEAALNGQRIGHNWLLPGRPLLTALQQGGASCPHCSPLGRLMIQSVSLSGSSMEGFMPITYEEDAVTTSSDMDIMLQLGPVLWEKTDAVCGGSQEATAGSRAAHGTTGADSGHQDDETVPRLRVVSTEIPGFVLLYQVKKEQCTHPDENLLSGDSVWQLFHRFFQVTDGEESEVTSSGPATSFEQQVLNNTCVIFDGFDMVPCLRANWWPSEEFFQRSRVRDWPPAVVREDIRQFGIHLVPVGAKDSSTELHEFRLSFSRPEVVAAWHLLPPQRNSLVALKTCKALLGSEGKPVKSYFLKTALFWLCQDSDVQQWTSIKQGMHMIIDSLERAINARYLGCFFWSDINLFRESSPADLAAMRRTLSLLRHNMTGLLIHHISPDIENRMAPIILREPSQQLSERQLRVCLVRMLLIWAFYSGISVITDGYRHHQSRVVRALIRVSAKTELALIFHRWSNEQQHVLLLALTVAPVDVMARCRLTSLDDLMFSWTVAPLFELLMPEDLPWMLGDPAAVHAWLKDQRRLPTGLSSPRALTDLLLNPPLVAEALRESVPWFWEFYQQFTMQGHGTAFDPPLSFDDVRRRALKIWDSSNTLAIFERLPRDGTQSPLCLYRQSREKAWQFFNDPQTRTEYDRLSRHLPDPWRLRKFVVTDPQ